MINGQEMMRLIDAISRDRNVEKEVLFRDIEQAMVSAARKHFNAIDTEEFHAELDRMTGAIKIWRGDEEISLESLGRIPAQTAKQVMIQRFREDERSSIYNEFVDRVGELVTGMAQRYEGGALVVSIGRAEGFMPRSEQIPSEQHQPGERVRCLILDVREAGNQVKIVLSRAAPDFIRRLFEVEVPEVAERIIEIKAMAREAGHRTKIAVSSIDSKVDAVGACVGVRGSRIKNIVDELGGEKIDIVRWNESSQILIQNALKPAEVVEISLCFELGRATVVVNEDQLSLAIGKRGQNVRLAARLTQWDVDILTPAEYTKGLDTLEETLKGVEGVTEEHIDRLAALGVISVFDIEEVGPTYLIETFNVDEATAQRMIETAGEKAKVVAEQQQKDKEEAERRKREGEQALAGRPGEQQAAAILGEILPSAPEGGSGGGAEGGDMGSSIVDMLEQRQEDADAVPPGGEEPTATDQADVDATASETRDEALAQDPAAGDEQEPSNGEVGPVGEGAEPEGSDPNEVEITKARQQGEPGEALADETPSDAGTLGESAPGEESPQDQAEVDKRS
ncbi:transcription termination factor NusA [Phycisphaerales bacterium AB-hyl4]|uniref:Transcription termination/antitermination protein NusA n=1 Tax=Natronomicrosphaera hydrolytica TaxID=3242702 RepID=A0ABV4U2T7_9BACT